MFFEQKHIRLFELLYCWVSFIKLKAIYIFAWGDETLKKALIANDPFLVITVHDKVTRENICTHEYIVSNEIISTNII